jgi:hypothetical protein
MPIPTDDTEEMLERASQWVSLVLSDMDGGGDTPSELAGKLVYQGLQALKAENESEVRYVLAELRRRWP